MAYGHKPVIGGAGGAGGVAVTGFHTYAFVLLAIALVLLGLLVLRLAATRTPRAVRRRRT